MSRVERWLFEAVPLGRLAAFRTVVYAFVGLNVAFQSGPVLAKADAPLDLYRPLLIARLLPVIPAPTPTVVTATFWALVVLAPLAAFGRAPRTLGVVVALLYGEWMIIAMSYGKVDHDRFGILVALALLPTVGRARHGDETPSEAAGWVLRMTQLAVVATYFLAAWAKLRFGGIEWLWGGTLAWAVSRRGTAFSRWLLDVPVVLQVAQVGIVAFEALSPLLFVVRERTRWILVGGLYAFHVVTVLALGIGFWPHQAAMTSFLPLERVRPIERVRERFGRSADPLALGVR